MHNKSRDIVFVTVIATVLPCFLALSQENPIEGRLVVEFEEGVVSLPPGQTTGPVNESTIRSVDVLEACGDIKATEITKTFANAQEGVTQVVSPITGSMVQIQDLSQYFVLSFPEGPPVQEAIDRFAQLSEVKSVEPDYVAILDTLPNDPLFSAQWHLKNNVNPKFDIKAPLAWNTARGTDIKIAIIDMGVRDDHEDLHAHIWYGPGSEIGYDTTTAGGRHGTYVAGIAGAVTDNSTGVAGVGWDVRIMPRIAPTFSITELADDIFDAASNGAHVINNSWHTHADYNYLRNAVRNAFNLGSVMTASMGNDPPSHYAWPAAYDSFVVACGALLWVNGGDTVYVRPDQNTGPFIDVTAPGDNIMTTSPMVWDPNLGYYTPVGLTSFSTPQVAGLAALLFSANPALSNMQIIDIIKRTARLFTGWETNPNAYGSGMIDTYQAVLLAHAYAGKSVDASSTWPNSARHILKGGGKLHEQFTSGGDIFYRRSSNNGTTWEMTKRI